MSHLLHQQTLVLLDQLTKELKQLRLWQEADVPASVLKSQQPFCCDTLTFEQWLQFVFIPKLTDMAQNHLPLPDNICVCPMAEETFKVKGKQLALLINIIADIDELLSGKRVQTMFVKTL